MSHPEAQLTASVYNTSDVELDPPVPTTSVHASSDVVEAIGGLSLQPCEACQRTEGVQPKDAKWFCSECDDLLCDECQNFHKRFKPTAGHSVVSMHKNCCMCFEKGKDVLAICYCKECEEFLCKNCKSNHQDFKLLKNHKIVSIQEHIRGRLSNPRSPRTEAKLDSHLFEKRPIIGGDTIQKMSAVPITTFSAKCEGDKRSCSITNSTFLPDGRLLLIDNTNDKIKMFGTSYNLIQQKSFTSGTRSIAAFDVNKIAVATKQSSIITLSAHDKLKEKEEIKLDFDCNGVDFINNTQIAITGYDTGQFAIYTIYGLKVVSKIYPFLSVPQYVTINREKEVAYVSDYFTKSVVALNLRAGCEVLFTIKFKQNETPEEVGLDKDGRIYVAVCDSNTVHQISPEGKPIGIILSKESGLCRPWALAFAPNGDRFIVGSGNSNSSNIVRVFSLIQKN